MLMPPEFEPVAVYGSNKTQIEPDDAVERLRIQSFDKVDRDLRVGSFHYFTMTTNLNQRNKTYFIVVFYNNCVAEKCFDKP